MTSTYAFETAEDGAALLRGEKDGYIYGRTKNPTQSVLEARIADLEGAEAGLVVASGMAAISATLWTLLSAGDLVVIDHTLYGNSYALFTRGLIRFGIRVEVADFTDPDDLARALALRPALVHFETPANPNLRVIDIAAVSALVMVDNTFATPVLQRPIGHGDLIAGVVVGPKAIIDRIRGYGLRYLTGATIAPLTAFLLLRGLKTLELRVERHSASAAAIAGLLADHPAVRRVDYPGLPGSPGHGIARRQMSGFGGLVSCELEGGLYPRQRFNKGLSMVVNVFRAIPFIILLVALLPFTRLIVGTTLGIWAAIVPLSIHLIAFYTRVAQVSLNEVDHGLIEAARAMGFRRWHIVRHVILPEALPDLIGGLGNLAIRYGYERYETQVLFEIIVILIVLVTSVQFGGEWLSRRVDHRR